MDEQHFLLAINPGSTSTKVSYFCESQLQTSKTFQHTMEELKEFRTVWEQFSFRLKIIQQWISAIRKCSAVVTVGGLLRSLEGGVYRINESMLRDAKNNLQGEHASNLGCALAYEIATIFHCPSFIVDAVSVDELEPLARYSGHPLILRKSLSHALNIHSTARRAAEDLQRNYVDSSFIVCHLGGGISVAPVRNGKIIDVNDAASDGPFSPERTGGLPLQQFISFCFSKKYSENEIRKLIMGNGGLAAYLGTNSAKIVEEKISNGDVQAKEIFEAMAYQIAKEIGAMATVLRGRVDAIIFTGGLAKSKMLTSWIEERVRFIAPVTIYSGEDEMRAMVEGALRVFTGEEDVKNY
jgi:butyrate kinase